MEEKTDSGGEEDEDEGEGANEGDMTVFFWTNTTDRESTRFWVDDLVAGWESKAIMQGKELLARPRVHDWWIMLSGGGWEAG